MSIKRIIFGVVAGLLVVGVLAYTHYAVHELGNSQIHSQIRIQERKTEQIETITQKVILGE